MPREILDHVVTEADRRLVITTTDEPGAGGAHHCYEVCWRSDFHGVVGSRSSFQIPFQNGPVSENGVNGATQEVLLAIVIDRLRSFQAGPFACRENAIALTKSEEALFWLQKRTRGRMHRGVEGQNKA